MSVAYAGTCFGDMFGDFVRGFGASTVEHSYNWREHARPAQIAPDGDWTTWLYVAGRGCIAAGTMIYDPSTGTETAVETLALSGLPIIVQSMTNDGPRPYWATAPFVKGMDHLYCVTLDDGRSVTVTRAHRFLTPNGWRPLSDLALDDLLACGDARHRSISAHDRATSPLSALCSMRTPEDSTDRYSQDPRRYGQPLPPDRDTGLALVPSQADAREHSPLSSHGDDPASLSEHSHRHRESDRLSRSSFGPFALLPAGDQGRAESFDHEPIPLSSRKPAPSRGTSDPTPRVHEVSLRQSAHVSKVVDLEDHRQDGSERHDPQVVGTPFAETCSSGAQSPSHSIPTRTTEPFDPCQKDVSSYLDYTIWKRIVSVKYAGYQVFYDLTVPGPANYFANGIYHHNSGKTRSGAEFIREEVMAGRMRRVALVGPTAADVRDVMVEGESGLMAVCDRYDFRPVYETSKRKVTFPNGAIALCFSSEEPERLRGPQADGAWLDELGAWKYPDATWSNLQFGLRLGQKPRQIVTSTPRPTKLLRSLMARVGKGIVLTRGTSYENLENLSENYREIIASFEGTRLGRQEIMGELLTDTPGALWTYELIERSRVAVAPEQFARIVVAIDPAITSGEESNETGIIVAARGFDGHGYILADRTGRYSPHEWATVALNTFDEYDADAIVIETNQGGDMAIQTIRSIRKNASIKGVHASRNKITRAEPISSLYEQSKIHHVGIFPQLEDQLTTFTPGATSPDRLDAMVWALTDLMVTGRPNAVGFDLSGMERVNPLAGIG